MVSWLCALEGHVGRTGLIGLGGVRFLAAFSAIELEDGFGANFPDPVRYLTMKFSISFVFRFSFIREAASRESRKFSDREKSSRTLALFRE